MKPTLSQALLLFFLLKLTAVYAQQSSQLNLYVGYYQVKEIPDLLLRVYQTASQKLFIVVPGEPDYEVYPTEKHQFRFISDSNPAGMKLKDYKLVFTLTDAKATGLTIHRPKRDFSSNLTAARNPALDQYAIDTESSLTSRRETEGFVYQFTPSDSSIVSKMVERVEAVYKDLLTDFKLKSIPKVTVKFYSNLDLYHNAVNSPLAPIWQTGSIAATNQYQEIRVSVPSNANQLTYGLQLGSVAHEYVHLLTLQISPDHQRPPVWLWEGIAVYKGCCQWVKPSELTYLKDGQYPGIMQIEREQDYGKSYELGYYIIEFLIDKWGWDSVLRLVQSGGNIKGALGVSPKQFNDDFFSFLSVRYKLNQR